MTIITIIIAKPKFVVKMVLVFLAFRRFRVRISVLELSVSSDSWFFLVTYVNCHGTERIRINYLFHVLSNNYLLISIPLMFYSLMTNEFFYCSTAPSELRLSTWGSSITLRHTKLGTGPLDKWSARRWDLYLTTHNNHKKKTSTLPLGLEFRVAQEASGRRSAPQITRPLEPAIWIDGIL